jgi:hypothetical protein
MFSNGKNYHHTTPQHTVHHCSPHRSHSVMCHFFQLFFDYMTTTDDGQQFKQRRSFSKFIFIFILFVHYTRPSRSGKGEAHTCIQMTNPNHPVTPVPPNATSLEMVPERHWTLFEPQRKFFFPYLIELV